MWKRIKKKNRDIGRDSEEKEEQDKGTDIRDNKREVK